MRANISSEDVSVVCDTKKVNLCLIMKNTAKKYTDYVDLVITDGGLYLEFLAMENRLSQSWQLSRQLVFRKHRADAAHVLMASRLKQKGPLLCTACRLEWFNFHSP